MSETWTTLKVLDWTTGRFARAGIESPRLEAQVLLAHILECDRVALYTSFDKPLGTEELAAYRALIQRRLAGESVAYLVGDKEFWSRSFAVDARVLVPRADTEVIIEAFLDRAGALPAGPIADVGTGSGIIAITLALELASKGNARAVHAVDVSADALDVARANAATHDAAVEFHHGSLLEPLAGIELAAIVSNLPYICSGEIDGLDPEVRCEPRLALDGGADGLDPIRALAAAAPAALQPGGLILLEHGMEQGAAVREILASTSAFDGIETLPDLASRDRVTLGVRQRT